MSHGIQKHDRGFVFGTTWHNLENYIQLERPVTVIEAESVLDYPLEKVPLFRKNENTGSFEETNCHGIVRSDHDILLTDGCSIGTRYTVENNIAMLRRIDEFLLARYPDLMIESVGTLFNGQTAFINLRVEENQIKGDKSPTETNLLYSNPIGNGSYLAYAHSTRVVCNNTLNISKAQAAVNKTLRKFSHTKNATAKIQEYLIDLSEVFLGLKHHTESMNLLASRPSTTQNIDNFMDEFFSLEDKKEKGKTIAKNNRETFLTVFEKQEKTMESETAHSRYGILQAYTDFIDHEGRKTEKTDEASIRWDSITGIRASKKNKALDYLLTV
jgi:phage/plasmid-like protein (TIGR03299 family)